MRWLALGGIFLALYPVLALAQQDAHATAEVANCLAKNGANYPIGYCSTSTPVPTSTPSPVPAKPTPVPVAPTEEPTSAPEATATPLPVLPASQDNPLLGYTRPYADHWLELALPQGRWAIYQADDCSPQISAWAWVVITSQDSGEVDLSSSNASCGIVAAQWLSDTPCSLDDNDQCSLDLDSSYWDMLGHLPTPEPTGTPVPVVSNTRVPVAAPIPAAPQVRYVQQPAEVRYVEVTPTPTDVPDITESTPVTNSTDRSTSTPIPTVIPWWLLTPTLVATPVPTATEEPQLTIASTDTEPPTPQPPVDWGNILLHTLGVIGVIALVICGALGLTKLASNNPAPPREEEDYP